MTHAVDEHRGVSTPRCGWQAQNPHVGVLTPREL